MSTNTENYNLVKPSYTDSADIQVLNNNFDKIDTALLQAYETATGTATVITLSDIKLVNGCSKTFIASANNSGSATTINGKNLYKPNTSIAPTLIAGKAYTVWYNSAGGCFFIKASAEGDADVSNVLATKKFSNDNDTGLVGTMPNNGAVNQALAINGTYTIPAGYHNGSGKVTQSITTKAGATYNPSTVQQVISSGQYLTGNQVIVPVTGTATDSDVMSGKTYNSAAGILRTGTATIQSLGGANLISGTVVLTSNASGDLYFPSSILPYTPSFLYFRISTGSSYLLTIFDFIRNLCTKPGNYVRSSSPSNGYEVRPISSVGGSYVISDHTVYDSSTYSQLASNTSYTVEWFGFTI